MALASVGGLLEALAFGADVQGLLAQESISEWALLSRVQLLSRLKEKGVARLTDRQVRMCSCARHPPL